MDCVFNSVVRDYIAMQKIDANLQTITFCMTGYYLCLYHEILIKEVLGSPMDTLMLRREWGEAVITLPDKMQAEIKAMAPAALVRDLGRQRLRDRAIILTRK